MAAYEGDYGRSRARRARYGMQYESDRPYLAQSRAFQRAPFGPRYDAEVEPGSVSRQIREERHFQEERAAPGEELRWGRERPPRAFRMSPGAPGAYDRGYSRGHGVDFGYAPGGREWTRGRPRGERPIGEGARRGYDRGW